MIKKIQRKFICLLEDNQRDQNVTMNKKKEQKILPFTIN